VRPSKKLLNWPLVLLLIFVGGAATGDADTASATTVILVRHAEKADGSRDPVLSEPGTARAIELSRVLADVEIDRLYASQFQRTALTLDPIARLKELDVQVFEIEGRDMPAYAQSFTDALLDSHSGETILVAGHSNTVPLLIESLGVDPPPALDKSDYDDLFIVVVEPGGNARLTHLHYGGSDEE
jgi:2,3-bisphosphoglycerate-dependent phosphoglycerate mutase